MHSFLITLRYQIRDTKVKIVEIFPPVVQSMRFPVDKPGYQLTGTAELHDYMPGGRNFGMPLDDFTDAAFKQLEQVCCLVCLQT